MAITYTYNGKEQTVAEIAEQIGMSRGGLHKRIKKCNYDINEAVKPVTRNKKIEMLGKVYGRLTVVAEAEKNKHGQRQVKCTCDCGNEVVTNASDVREGHTKSCGCWNKEQLTSHGMNGTKLYKIWSAIQQRCTNPKHKHYASYGGRGITMCDEWKESFEKFYEDMGDSNGLTIDRIDNDKGYSKENCRWVSMKVQANNTRTNVLIEYNGETKTSSEWSNIVGIPADTIRRRYHDGWDIDRVMTEPIGTPKTRTKFVKAVVQYDKDGNKVAEYSSVTCASRETGITTTGISYSAKGTRKTAGGYIWRYKGDMDGM